ncbi:hypothetical protein VE03_00028 [Pseudogymnoascus sp. 23342-1-I1]|nr:hypothetical protein VE03_00028 [Pseudogymnoascus sp. 23342-1-I1]
MRSLSLLPLLALSASAQLCADDPTICPPDTFCQVTGVADPSCVGGASVSASTCPSGGTGSGAANWAQCGGQGFAGPTCCVGAPEWLCFYANLYHSQCLRIISAAPAGSTTVAPTTLATSTTTAAATTSTAARVCTGHWGQCGGLGWTGPTCCQDEGEWFCEVANTWFSMCHPRPVSVGSSAVATPSG